MKRNRFPIVSLCAIVTTFASACADVAEQMADGEVEAAALQASALPSIGKVTLSGSGCSASDIPKGMPVSGKDGQAFQFRFAKFALLVSPETPEIIKYADCTIEAEILAPQGIQYALTSLVTTVAVVIQDGMEAEAGVTYWLDGVPQSVKTTQSKSQPLRGPMDDPYYRITDYLDTSNVVWSKCGATHALRARMRLKLVNSEPKRTGRISFDYADAQVSTLEVGVASRQCTSSA